jgi:hypothetical protein
MRIPIFLFTCIFFTHIYAQQIGAFSDYEKKFYVFDNGLFHQLEFLPVKSVVIGDHCIGYETNSGELKAYANHMSYEVSPMVTSYLVTNHLMCFTVGQQLYVFEDGMKTVLSKYMGKYQAGDSIVAFFDTESRYFLAYYNKEIHQLEDGIIYEDNRLFKVGVNMVAYVDAFQNFKVFYKGNSTSLFKITQSLHVEVGRNIVAFVDPQKSTFQVFYNDQIIDLEQFTPKSFQVGYEKVAYIDQMDNFKLYDNGNLYVISNFAPNTYQFKDDILVYDQQGQFYTFINGEALLIENYIPVEYNVNGNLVVYIDQNGYLSIFEDGQKKILSYEKINEYTSAGDMVIFNEGVNTIKVYYHQKIYTR